MFKNGWFHTGDLGEIDQRGRLQILYRKKTVVLIDGKEVYPDEVEAVLCKHPKVRAAMVVSDHSGQGRTVDLKAFVVAKEPFGTEVLLEFCEDRLPLYKIPHQIQFREELPRSWKKVLNGSGQDYPLWGEF